MASVLAHSAIPLIVRTRPERRLTIALLLLSLWPDLDYLTLAFEVRPNEMLGHRGITHSLALAVIASAIAWLFVRKDFVQLLGVAASHGVLDAITGSEGAALLAPFSNVRLHLPIVPSCPMGLNEWLGA